MRYHQKTKTDNRNVSTHLHRYTLGSIVALGLFGAVYVLLIYPIIVERDNKKVSPDQNSSMNAELFNQTIVNEVYQSPKMREILTTQKDIITAQGSESEIASLFHLLEIALIQQDKATLEQIIDAIHSHLAGSNAIDAQALFRLTVFTHRSIDLVLASEYGRQYQKEIAQLVDALEQPMQRLHELYPENAAEIDPYTNQKIWLAYAFLRSSDHYNNIAIESTGQALLQESLNTQRNDGVLPELGGSDTHYQAVSLAGLWNIYTFVSNDYSVAMAIQRGFKWMVPRINNCIDDDQNTRTAVVAAFSPEKKQINPVEVAHSMLLAASVVPEDGLDVVQKILTTCEIFSAS